MALAFWFFGKVQTLGRRRTPFENARTIPPAPRLQVEPRKEIHDYWEEQQKILNSYGWVDEHNGVVRIPVDRAMRFVLEQGLPARAAGRAARAAATRHLLSRTFRIRIRWDRADSCWSGRGFTR